MPNSSAVAAAKDILALMYPKQALERERRVDLAITDDGRPRADRAIGLLSDESRPPFEAEQISVEGVDAANMQEYVESLGGVYAPTGATYITQTANGTLTGEQVLSVLASGLLNVTTGTGVLSTATSLEPYLALSSTMQSTADTVSTTSAVTYATAIDDTITLAAGTWVLWAIGFVNLRNTASASNDVKIVVDGTDSTIITRTFGSTNPSAAQVLIGSKTGVTGGGTKTIAVQYKVTASGTAEAFAAGILTIGRRTA